MGTNNLVHFIDKKLKPRRGRIKQLLTVAYIVKVLVAQSCPTLVTHGLLGSFVHGILQARILEWVAIPFSRESS